MTPRPPDFGVFPGPDTPDPLEWLQCYAQARGRPLRVLHIGNIANNAYNNAKIQRRFGIDADVLCHNYYHIMACPEWEDADYAGDVGDPFFPDWSAVDLRGFQRPRWFAQGPIDTCVRYLLAHVEASSARDRRWRLLCFERWLACGTDERLTQAEKQALAALRDARPASLRSSGSFAKRLAAWRACLGLAAASLRPGGSFVERLAAWWACLGLVAVVNRHYTRSFLRDAIARGRRSLDLFERWFGKRVVPLLRGDPHFKLELLDTPLPEVKAYVRAFWHPLLKVLFSHYDVIQAYATYTIMPYVAGRRDYLAYEHGTIRRIPFEETAEGRLCATTYHTAATVLVTNSDNLTAVEKLEFPASKVVCLPHAFDSDKLDRFAKSFTSAGKPDGAPVFLSPTRQHWVGEDPGWAKGNDRVIRALRLLRDRGMACHLRLVDWGNDVGATRRLIAELGLTDAVAWIPPMKKRELWAQYLEAVAVIDQFIVPAIGGVTFEAMMLGRRVITAIDLEQTRRFFGEPPPVFPCVTTEEIAEAMAHVIADPADAGGRGAANREWMQKHHSARRIVEIQIEAYRHLMEPAHGGPVSGEQAVCSAASPTTAPTS
jgi:glycosyltransferase involved in cell wall biosynthesis